LCTSLGHHSFNQRVEHPCQYSVWAYKDKRKCMPRLDPKRKRINTLCHGDLGRSKNWGKEKQELSWQFLSPYTKRNFGRRTMNQPVKNKLLSSPFFLVGTQRESNSSPLPPKHYQSTKRFWTSPLVITYRFSVQVTSSKRGE
jgi:hypothetical protein